MQADFFFKKNEKRKPDVTYWLLTEFMKYQGQFAPNNPK